VPLKPASTSQVDTPWDTPAAVSKTVDAGVFAAVFGYAGCGKTELACSAVSAASGLPLLVINFDPDIDTIRDRTDISVWPKKPGLNWSRISTFVTKIRDQKHPFHTIVFDTGNNLYRYALRDVKSRGSDRRDPRQIFGEANDMVNAIIIDFATVAAEKGINVIWNWHAEDVIEGQGDAAKLYIRPDATPGVLKTIYQSHPTIVYLEERMQGKRRAYLHNTMKVIAKVHQPQGTGALSTEIDQPDMGRIIDHLRGVRKYDAGRQTALRTSKAG
jgi:AAA domain-containing protein